MEEKPIRQKVVWVNPAIPNTVANLNVLLDDGWYIAETHYFKDFSDNGRETANFYHILWTGTLNNVDGGMEFGFEIEE